MRKTTMQMLERSIVEKIVEIVAATGDLSRNLNIVARKRELIAAVAASIDADVHIWTTSAANPDRQGDVVTTCMIDGGWRDDRQKAMAFEALTSRELDCLQAPVVQAVTTGSVVITTRPEFISDELWESQAAIWRRTGLEHMLILVYPITKNCFSGIGLHRYPTKPNFSERDKAVASLVFNHLPWLHEHGTHEGAEPLIIGLSPRERQVLVLLLEGCAVKAIAARLEISEHTVGDYVKNIYKHFAVSSRGELQAFFLTGSRI